MRPTAAKLSRDGYVPGVTNVGVRDATQEVVDQSSLLAHNAAEDLKRQGRELGIGAGYGAGAAVLAVFAIGFTFATIAVALDLVLPLWASMLIVTLLLFAIVAVLVFSRAGSSRRERRPCPCSKLTVTASRWRSDTCARSSRERRSCA